MRHGHDETAEAYLSLLTTNTITKCQFRHAGADLNIQINVPEMTLDVTARAVTVFRTSS